MSRRPILEVRMLGRFEVRHRGTALSDDAWPRRKTAALLKVLATDRGRHVSQDELIERIFPDLDPIKARRNLQNRVSELRRVIEPGLESAAESQFIRTDHEGYRFVPTVDCWIDVEAFEAAIHAARRHEVDERWTDAERLLRSAVELYAGDYLPEDRYEDWAEGPRRRLHDQYISALTRLASCSARLGRHADAGEWAERAFALEPHRESLCAQLMGHLRHEGQRTEALTVYERHRDALRATFEKAPSPEIDAIRSRILTDGSTATDGPNRPSQPSIAVLPFEDLDPDETRAYVADGLTDDVIGQLGKLRGVRVLAASAVARYRRGRPQISEIARELDVSDVLTGSVRQDGDKARIVVALIDAETGEHRWSETYDRRLVDVFEIQREIADRIARSLETEISPDERHRIGQGTTSNVEAHHHYLRGRHFLSQRTPTSFEKARASFEAAIALDSDYSAAHAGLAEAHSQIAWFGYASARTAFPRARDAALRALEIDPELPEAHVVLGQVAMNHDWNWPAALGSFRKALSLQPSSALARESHAECLAAMGRFDVAIAEMGKALHLDPLSLVLRTSLGWICYLARRPEEAASHSREALDLDEEYPTAHWVLGLTRLTQGAYDEAVGHFTRAKHVLPSQRALDAEIGYAHARSGRPDLATSILRKLTSGSALPDSISLAILHLGLGDRSTSLDWLDRARRERARHMAFLGVDPLFNELRDDPRFDDLLRHIGPVSAAST